MKEILMSDFEITPPAALLGLIRTDDAVTVTFDLRFENRAAFPSRRRAGPHALNEP